MLASMVVILIATTGVAGLDTEALPCPNPVTAWTGSTGPYTSTFDLAVDAEGNVILCGYFGTGADLDPTDGVDERTTNGHHRDIYVTKIYADGSYAWSYTVGALDVTDTARGIAIDPDGNIVVAGTFQGTVDFDPTDAVDEHSYTGGYTGFVTKLAPDGTYLWTLSFGGTGWVGVTDLSLDADGNILLVGHFDGSIDFDPGPNVWMEQGGADVFVSKLAPDGSHQWTYTFGNWPAYDAGEDIAVDHQGNVYLTGNFRGTVDFDPGPGVDQHTVVGWVENLFVTKYYGDGSYAWTRTYNMDAFDIAVTADGGCITTGLFSDTVDFDPGEGVDLRTSHQDPDGNPSSDIFVTKLSADGSYGWTYTVGGPSGEGAGAVVVDGSGNLLLVGYYRGTIDFDPGLRVDLHESIGQKDAFVTKLSTEGTYRWTRTFGGQGTEHPRKVVLDRGGNAFVVGYYWASPPYSDYDPGCEVAVLRSHLEGSTDAFIVKLACPELSADFDGNGVVDLHDAAQFQLCFTDEGPATCGDGCSRLDLDPDDDIDLDDYTVFRKRLKGPQHRDLATPNSPITPRR